MLNCVDIDAKVIYKANVWRFRAELILSTNLKIFSSRFINDGRNGK